jgi:hypothetical protein
MQERVVYFLGAGFSQPRGLPVMSNFIDKSKELRRLNPEKYGYFADVLSQITNIAIVMQHFETDFYNIEEILSILEMSTQLEGESPSESFRKYIADVISAYTPKIEPLEQIESRSDWEEKMFGEESIWKDYGQFVASLHNLTLRLNLKGGRAHLGLQPARNAETRYDVISLNYDCVLEEVCKFLGAQYHADYLLRFQRTEFDTSATEPGLPWLAKLHGSVDKPEDIIPPTWNKALDESIREQWKAAYHLLSEADHIRVLGYSLPTSDAYVQYLLKSSIVRAEREAFTPLKTFHVITKDSDGETRDRYEHLIKFRGFRFADASINLYFRHIQPQMQSVGMLGREWEVPFTTLEDAHKQFMNRAGDSHWKIPDDIPLPPRRNRSRTREPLTVTWKRYFTLSTQAAPNPRAAFWFGGY